jgi:RNA polymerase sigma factor (sigma-70 family)
MAPKDLDSELETKIDGFVDDAIEKKERAQELKRLLGILGEPCHNLLDLFYYQELKFSDIAKELQENEGRLRKRKYDCLKKLHQLILKEGIEL